MAVNKVVMNTAHGEEVLIDLTSDTVTPSTLIKGATAHDASGNIVEGTVVIQRYYTGSSEPSNSLGNDGDLYLKV